MRSAQSLGVSSALVLGVLGVAAGVAASATGSSIAAAATTTFRETFSDGSNNGSWTWGNANDTVQPAGGNPGAFLENDFLDTYAPQPRTGFGVVSQFTGDWRAKQVNGIAIDLKTFSVDFSAAERPLSVLLISDANTPDPADDCTIYIVGPTDVPVPEAPWTRFRFDIPSASPVAPPEWKILNGCPGLTIDEAWDEVIGDVDQVSYFFGDPTYFFIFQVWDVGMDNPSIRFGTP